jgi:hypothetical protein
MKSEFKTFVKIEEAISLIPLPLAMIAADNKKLLAYNAALGFVIGAPSLNYLIGKNVYDEYPERYADIIFRNAERVIQERRTFVFEESIIDITTKEERSFLTTRGPIFDDKGIEVIGTLETAVEITLLKLAGNYEKIRALHNNICVVASAKLVL